MRITIFLSIVVISLMLIGCSTRTEHLVKPNILFITTESQAWEDISSQITFLKMPALDRLLREGVVFQNHYSNAPLNQPAKYSIVSGLYPHEHHLMEESGNWLPENSPVLMESLSESGYYTIGVGKMDFKPWERMAGFDKRIIAEGLGEHQADTLKHDDYYRFLKTAGLSRWDYLKDQACPEFNRITTWPYNDSLHINSYIGSEACNFIENYNISENKPWFMWVSFVGPRYPWLPLKETFDNYSQEVMPGCRYAEKELTGKPFDQTVTRYSYMRAIVDSLEENPKNEKKIISDVKTAHYACLSDIDAWIGNLINTLEKTGENENTLIVFTSAEGALLGDHYNFNGGNAYERAAHVPFIVWFPGEFKKRHVDGFSSHVDIFPTLIEIAGGVVPTGLKGKSLLPAISGNKLDNNHAFIEILNNISIVTPDYKLGYYTPYKEGELYNRNEDADELKNIYTNSKYSGIVDSLTKIMNVFYPGMVKVLNDRKEYTSPPTFVELHQGESCNGEKSPDMANKPFKMMVEVEILKNASGPVVTYDVDNIHGFSLFFEDGYLCFGIRKWGKDQLYRISQKIEDKKVKINFDMKLNGTFIISSPSLINSYSFKSNWPIPETVGHPEYFPKSLNAGISGEGWTKPYGNLPWGKDLEGNVRSCLLSVGY